MNRNFVFSKNLKRLFTVLLLGTTVVTLSGCQTNAIDYPTGSLDSKAIYASNGTENVTIGEVYDELRGSSIDYFNRQVELTVWDKYIVKVKGVFNGTDENQKTELNEKLKEYVLTDIFSEFDGEELIKNKQIDNLTSVNKYIDEMYKNNVSVNLTDLIDADGTIRINSTTNEVDITISEDVKAYYYPNLAKFLYAKEELAKEIEDTNKDAKGDKSKEYFTDKVIADYHDDNFLYDTEVDALIVRFVNQKEADEVLRSFGIKAYKGEFYQIKEEQESGVDVIWETAAEYNDYYDDYEIDPRGDNADEAIDKLENGKEIILKLFVHMYNYIYTYRDPLTYTNMTTTSSNTTNKAFLDNYYLTKDIKEETHLGYEALVTELTSGTNEEFTNFDQEKLDNYSSSLTKYVHDDLATKEEAIKDAKAEFDKNKAEAEANGEEWNEEFNEDEVEYSQYTVTSKSYSDAYYLVFKMDESKTNDLFERTTNEDDEEEIEFFDTPEAIALIEKITAELTTDALTEEYITEQTDEYGKDVKFRFYDSELMYSYMRTNNDFDGKLKSSKTDIARIEFDGKTTYISVDDTFAYLEKISGSYTAVNLLFTKHIKTTEFYTELNSKEHQKELEDRLNGEFSSFSNDMYASFGLPASIGKYNFMLSRYNTANVDEAIDFLQVSQAIENYFESVLDESSLYTELAKFAEVSYNNFFNLTTTNIVVYADMDEDGVADRDFFTTHAEAATNVADAIELINDIVEYVSSNSLAYATSFTDVVEEYNDSTRIVPNTSNPADGGTIEETWAKHRSKGLLIKTSDAVELTNASTENADYMTLIKDLYNDTNNEIMIDNTFSSAYLVTDDYKTLNDGVNLTLITAGKGKTEIDVDSEKSELYKNVPVLYKDGYKLFDVSSTGPFANASQMEVYSREYLLTGQVISLPEGATAQLTEYLNPFLDLYKSEISRTMLKYNIMTVTSSYTNFDENLKRHIKYLQNTEDAYTTSENNDGWWTSPIYKGGIV